MFGLTSKDFFEVIWFGLCILVSIYSFATYGYNVWFKPEEFMKADNERKLKSPRWLRFFMMSTTPRQDLWIARMSYLIAFLVVSGLVFFILRRLLVTMW